MRNRHPASLDVRVALLKYCADKSFNQDFHGSVTRGPIWQYWAQGRSDAPPLVKECFRSVERHCTDRQIIVIDDQSIEQYVEIPACMEKVRRSNKTHFSDYLRVALLLKYGGTWIDATVFLSGAPDHALVEAPFFAFTRPADPFLLSSWFIHASAGHPVISALKTCLERYWTDREDLIDYFLLHFLFEGLVTLHPELRRQWNAAPRYSSAIAHEMQGALHDEFSEKRYSYFASRSNVHKLTYKLPEASHPYITFKDVIESGDFTNWRSLARPDTGPAA